MPVPFDPRPVRPSPATASVPAGNDAAAHTQAPEANQSLQLLQPTGRYEDLPAELLPMKFLSNTDIASLRQSDARSNAAAVPGLDGARKALFEAHDDHQKIRLAQSQAPTERRHLFEPQLRSIERQIEVTKACSDLEAQLERVRISLADTPDDPELLDEAASLLQKGGRFEEAAVALERKINFSEFEGSDYARLCHATSCAGHPDRSLAIMGEVHRAIQEPGWSEDWFNCTFAREKGEALLLRNDPQDAQAALNIDDLSWQRGRHFPIARHRAGENMPAGEPNGRVSHGAAYYICTGDMEQARRSLESIAQLSSSFSGIRMHQSELVLQDPLVRASPHFTEIEQLPIWKTIEDIAGIYPEMALVSAALHIPRLSDAEVRERGGRPLLDFATVDFARYETDED